MKTPGVSIYLIERLNPPFCPMQFGSERVGRIASGDGPGDMKIVYIIDHLRPDGTQFFLLQLAEGLQQRGHRQAILCLNDDSDAAFISSIGRVVDKIEVIGRKKLLVGIGLLRMWFFLRQGGFDTGVTLLFASDVVGRILCRLSGIPRLLGSIRVRSTLHAPWQRWLLRRTAPLADRVVLNSKHLVDAAIREEGLRPEQIIVIPNGVSVSDFDRPGTGAELRAEFGLPETCCLAGAMGRLTHQKGFDVLLQALHILHRPQLRLLVAGAGPDRLKLARLSEELGLARQVQFVGYYRRAAHFLAGLDLFVHPARLEGMPNAVMQAMASALPVVATAVDGTRELIEDGVHGWQVQPDDAGALAQAIAHALDHPEEARRRGQQARARIRLAFSPEAHLNNWENVLNLT